MGIHASVTTVPPPPHLSTGGQRCLCVCRGGTLWIIYCGRGCWSVIKSFAWGESRDILAQRILDKVVGRKIYALCVQPVIYFNLLQAS